jgi:hypothetical protein
VLPRIYYSQKTQYTRGPKLSLKLAYDSKAYRDTLISTATLDLTTLSCAGRHMTVAPTGGNNHNHKGPQGTHTIQKGAHRWSKETDGAVCNKETALRMYKKRKDLREDGEPSLKDC